MTPISNSSSIQAMACVLSFPSRSVRGSGLLQAGRAIQPLQRTARTASDQENIQRAQAKRERRNLRNLAAAGNPKSGLKIVATP
jgi:hypothetical protein